MSVDLTFLRKELPYLSKETLEKIAPKMSEEDIKTLEILMPADRRTTEKIGILKIYWTSCRQAENQYRRSESASSTSKISSLKDKEIRRI